MLSKRGQTQKTTCYLIYLNEFQERQICRDEKQINGYLSPAVGRVVTANGHEGSFGGDRNVLQLDWSGSCTTLYIY